MTPVPLPLQLLAARRFLSLMPDEVFNIYIAPLIKAHTWPFNAHGLPITAEAKRWFQMFDLQNVQTIRQLSWKREELTLRSTFFHPRSYQVITMLIEHHSGIRLHAGIAKVADSRNKLFRAREYIAQTGRLPAPVVLQTDWEGFRILDGNHRIAALMSFGNTADAPIDAWIGTQTFGI